MLALLVRALFRALALQHTEAGDGDMAGNDSMKIMDHEIE